MILKDLAISSGKECQISNHAQSINSIDLTQEWK